jgi:hypothetical protein
MQLRLAAAAALAALAAPTGAFASDLQAEVRVGEPDFTLSLRGPVQDQVQWRLDASYGQRSMTKTFREKDFNVDWTRQELTAALEIAPFNNGFRAVMGLSYDMGHARAMNQPINGTVTIKGRHYTLNEIGTLSASMHPESRVVPYLALGWRGDLPVKGWSWGIEAGAVAQSYTGTISASCGPALNASDCAKLQRDLAHDEDRLNNSLSKREWLPRASIGISRTF